VSGTCRAGVSDAGSGARSDIHVSEVAARDPSDAPRFDLAEDQAGAPDQLVLDVLPDVPAAIDILESRAGRDANVTGQPSEDAPSDCVGEDSLDLARDSGGPSDLGHPLVDLEPDATVAVTLDAPSWEAGLGASFDSPSTAKDGTPDSDSPPADAAPDVAGRVPADAPPDSILPPVSPDAADRDGDGAADGAVVGVSWADFLARSPREPWAGGRFIVDGDLAFDDAGLQRYFQAWFAAAGVSQENLPPMGATAWWPSPDSMALSYCISTDFSSNLPAVEAAMQTAATSWSDRVGVAYTYLPDEDSNCNADNTHVTFDIRPVSGAGYAAVSFFPDSARANRSVLLDTSVFAGNPNLDPAAVLRHQLGHTLGFQHEYLWLDPACTSEDSQLAVRIANYDSDTVMHLPACRPSESGGTLQTEGDLVGAVTVYGLSPALIATTEI